MLPAPGFRDRANGALSSISLGYSWASAIRGTSGMNLHFSMTSLNPSNAYSRVYGFQLRCLSE